MVFCTKCGGQMDERAAFCPQCGTAHRPGSGTAPGAGNAAAGSSAGAPGGLSENTAAALSYALGWLTGIIFLLIDKRPYVRFHAAQSLVVFGVLHVLRSVLAVLFGVGIFAGGRHLLAPGVLVLHVISLATLVLWILLLIKAYQGEKFRVPVACEIADGLVGK